MNKLLILFLAFSSLLPAQWTCTLNTNGDGINNLSYNNVNYSLAIGYVVYAYWTPPASAEGSITPQTLGTHSTTSTTCPATATNAYSDAGHSTGWSLAVAYSGIATNTLQVDVTITNNEATDTLRPFINPLAFKLPSVTTSADPNGFNWLLQNTAPLGYFTYGSQSIAWWISPSNKNYNVADFGIGDNESYRLELQDFVNGPSTYGDFIAPGGTSHYTIYLRVGTSGQSAYQLAPEAFTSYSAQFPWIAAGPDRRPIARDFFTTGAACNQVNDPRCYVGTTALNNPTQFLADMTAHVNGAIAVMNAMTPKPQGVIIWDLEGQEFYQSLSYVGDPYHLSLFAPEMDSIADTLINLYKAAGYKIGLTIRPQHVGISASLPATCVHSATTGLSDVYVLTNATYPYRGYFCSATNTWTQGGPVAPVVSGPGVQTDATSYAALLADMSQKISYAITRWGVSMFYVDSNGWASDGTRFGPPIWADLSAAFPGVVFFPEHREYGAYAGASAYNGDQPLQILETETIPRQLWSQSFTNTISVAGWASNTSYGTATNILDTNLHVQQGTNSGTSGMSTPIWNNQIGNSCTGAGSPPCATTDGTQTWKDIGSLVTGVTTGDTLLCDCWFSWSGVTNTSAVFTSASTINGSLKITDSNSGKNINIDAKPAAAGNYPYYQDVYFASTRNGLAASTTHCLKQGSVSCYQSGTLQSSATLNLSGLGFMQIRYYDFTGVLRFSGVASTLVIP